MACEWVTLDEIKSLLDTGSLSDADIMTLLIGAVSFITKNMGGSFGLVGWIYYDDTNADTATVTINATTLTITVTGFGAMTASFTLANYSHIADLADAIEGYSGWHFWFVDDKPTDQSPQYLKQISSTSCLGIENAIWLCISRWVENHDGGTSHIFSDYRIRYVISVLEDGTDQTSRWVHKRSNSVIRKNSQGGQYTWYRREPWSKAYPANICLTYVPRDFNPPRGLLREVLRLLLLNSITATGFKSENIGRYSYTKGDGEWPGIWAILSAMQGNYGFVGTVVGAL